MQLIKSLLLANYFINMAFAFLTSIRTVASSQRGLPSAAASSRGGAALFGTTKSQVRDALAERDEEGSFKRRDSAWRNWVSSEKDAKFPPEMDRYHLYVAYACPWAHRTLIVRALKGLQEVIPVTVVYPIWQYTKPDNEGDTHRGWIFGNPGGKPLKNTDGLGSFPAAYPNNEPNPLFDNTKSIRDLYDIAGDEDGKYTVPILWDKKQGTIVSNESSEIIRMFNSEFNELAKNPDLDLYPEALQEAIDEVNDWVYPGINNGVYQCGFATSQNAYDVAIKNLTESFDRVAEILQKQRYIAGDQLTEADVRLFVTLLRYDEVYYVYFKCNTRSVMDTPAILNYCRDIYQAPGVADTVDMEQIKAHYYCSHTELNTYSIIPKGPGFMKLLEEPHNHDEM